MFVTKKQPTSYWDFDNREWPPGDSFQLQTVPHLVLLWVGCEASDLRPRSRGSSYLQPICGDNLNLFPTTTLKARELETTKKMTSSGSTPLAGAMQNLLSKRKACSSFRSLTISPPTSIDFSSNDFLSLSTSAELKAAYLQELQTSHDFRLGSGGSRLLDGNSSYAEQLETDIADFHHAPAGLLFNSGFDANSSIFACIPQAGDVIFYDEFIHASVHEGMRLSRADARSSFLHNSVPDLETQLSKLMLENALVSAGRCNVFVATESLFVSGVNSAPKALSSEVFLDQRV